MNKVTEYVNQNLKKEVILWGDIVSTYDLKFDTPNQTNLQLWNHNQGASS
jgi:S-ribosylhomocysteine lyase LuxS involved in autoinducer biosynthesis